MIMNYYALNQRIGFSQKIGLSTFEQWSLPNSCKEFARFFQKKPKKYGFVTKSVWVQPLQSIEMWEFIFLPKYDEENSR